MLKKLILVALFALYAPICHAQVVTLLDGLTAKQAFINTDSKVKNLTSFTIISTDDTKDYGKLNILLHGWSIDVGPSYDALDAIDGGAVMLGKNLNQLFQMLPVNFWLKDKLDLTLYPAGDFISRDNGINGAGLRHHFAYGAAVISATVKFGPQGK